MKDSIIHTTEKRIGSQSKLSYNRGNKLHPNRDLIWLLKK